MNKETEKYISLFEKYAKENYKKCLREAGGKFSSPYFVPGAYYSRELWDWDSWLTGIALADIAAGTDISAYQRGCVLDFLRAADGEGRLPINIVADGESIFDLKPGVQVNIHKPCLAMQAWFVSERYGDVSWLKDDFSAMKNYIAWYEKNCYHAESGLFFWINDFAIGVDNDPCVFYRPDRSTAAIFLNCLMYSEYLAMEKLSRRLGDVAEEYAKKAEDLGEAIRRECWDDRDGFFYSADVLLKPVDKNEWLHSGAPRHWHTLPMRIGVWSGFLPLWNGIATKEQAERLVREHYLNEKTFYAPFGVRSVSKAEKMYAIRPSGNPSCWLGPIWINANWFVFSGLLRYGYEKEAMELAEKTVTLLGRDIERCGDIHEYYHPETGEGILNKGFQSWNLLAYCMGAWLKKNG